MYRYVDMIRSITSGFFAVFLISLSGCGSETRNIQVLTQIPVRGLQNLPNGLVTPQDVLTGGGPLGGLPNSNYCLQDDVRILYLDQRPGFQPLFRKINLITARETSGPWADPPAGSKGLNDAISWISSKSFLREPLVIPVPKDSGGVIRIIGSFVFPNNEGTNPTCSRVNPSGTPYPTYSLWGEVPLTPGGPLSVNLPINMIASVVTPIVGNPGSDAYLTPALVGGSPSTPPPLAANPDLLIKCKNYSDRRSCMNRGLMELRFVLSPNFFFNLDASPNEVALRYGQAPNLDPIIQLFKPYSGSYQYLYLPRVAFPEFEYRLRTVPGNTNSEQKTIKVRIDWGAKRYQYINPFAAGSPLLDHPMVNCSGSAWGMLLPSKNLPSLIMAPDCGNSINPPNVYLTDLGVGFN